MFDRFDDAARRAVVMAQEEARVHHASPIEIDHLLLAVLRMHDDRGTAAALSALSCTVPELYEAVDAEVPTGPHRAEGPIPFATSTKAVFAQSLQEALARKDTRIGNEHLLLAIAARGGTVSSAALAEHGATHAAMLAALAGEPGAGFQVKTTKGLGRFRKSGKGST